METRFLNRSQEEGVFSVCKSSLAESGHIETLDLEYHAQNAAMELELSQISKGSFCNSREFLKLPGLLVTQQCWSRACIARGQVPPGRVILGIDQQPSGRDAINWCGTPLTRNRLAFARAGDEFEFTTSEHSQESILLIDHREFDTLLDEDHIRLSHDMRALKVSPEIWHDFQSTLSSIIDHYSKQPLLLDRRARLEADRTVLHELILRSLDPVDALPGRFASTSSTVKDALDILASMEEPISIRELANTLNVTRRALEIGFQKYVGIPPSLYSRRLRLNRAYQDLRAVKPKESRVIDIAEKWGFHHPGRFSVEYRNMFGEKPSSTLNKSPTLRSKPIIRP